MKKNNANLKFESKFKKKMRPYTIGFLTVGLIGVSIFTTIKLVNLTNNKQENIKQSEEAQQLENGGYLSIVNNIDEQESFSEDMKTFVKKYYEKKGAYTYKEKGKAYVLISAGKITDSTGYAITYDAPEYDDTKNMVTINYELYPYAASEHQKKNEPDYVILEVKYVDNVIIRENTTISE